MQVAEGLGQAGEGPQVDAGLRLIKDHEPGILGQQRGDLDALDLAAGQARVHVAAEIIPRAQADLRQVGTGLVVRERFSSRDGQQVRDLHALEPRRLLEGVGDAAAGAVGDGEGRDVFTVKQDLAAGRRSKAHDELGERRLAAAIRAGDHEELPVLNVQTDVFDNVCAALRVAGRQTEIFECQHVGSSFSET